MQGLKIAHIQEALAANVRRHRTRMGLSQEAFAELLGVSGRYVQRIEQGQSEPSLKMLVSIAAALNLSFVMLFKRAPAVKRAPGRPRAKH
jgi:transcriptional regulator with XRE-family HTH domain